MNRPPDIHAPLWERITRERSAEFHGIHGPHHWARVERNGLYIARDSGANTDVVRMFALFHDACRINDGFDPQHGERGAAYALELRPLLDFLDDSAFDQLVSACTWHTDQVHHGDPTIQTCFDADRLDLERVGIAPDPAYLNTETARRLDGTRALHELDALPLRELRNPMRM